MREFVPVTQVWIPTIDDDTETKIAIENKNAKNGIENQKREIKIERLDMIIPNP